MCTEIFLVGRKWYSFQSMVGFSALKMLKEHALSNHHHFHRNNLLAAIERSTLVCVCFYQLNLLHSIIPPIFKDVMCNFNAYSRISPNLAPHMNIYPHYGDLWRSWALGSTRLWFCVRGKYINKSFPLGFTWREIGMMYCHKSLISAMARGGKVGPVARY